MKKAKLLQALEMDDPFIGYKPMATSVLGGFHSDSQVFQFVIKKARPGLIIEVGSFVGFSAITMANQIKRLDLECAILCVDTWLGSLEYWRNKQSRKDSGLILQHGYPTWYSSFMTNIAASGNADLVVPLPLPSLIAARLLKEKNIVADLVYLDASHDEKDVYDDLAAYWDLFKQSGALFGDDWQWDSVRSAVERFAKEHNAELQHDAINWILQKKP